MVLRYIIVRFMIATFLLLLKFMSESDTNSEKKISESKNVNSVLHCWFFLYTKYIIYNAHAII